MKNQNEVEEEKDDKDIDKERNKFSTIRKKKQQIDTASVRKVVGGKANKLIDAQHNEIFVSI